MKLGEVLKKKDYYQRCLLEISSLIQQASTAVDKYEDKDNRDRIESLLSEFSKAFDAYQRYSLLYSKAESASVIHFSDGSEVSIKDAIVVKEAIRLKYDCYKNILNKIVNNQDKMVSIDMDELASSILKCNDDISSIDIKIEKALWELEV